jgi:adenosylcobinamide-GDP ribazoletransferase
MIDQRLSLWQLICSAGRFLTRLPWPNPGTPTPLQFGYTPLAYPLVGFVFGIVLLILGDIVSSLPADLSALIVVIAWIWGTGALHLDGLADCADAWVGGLGDRHRTLVILKDPHLGVSGTTTLVLTILAKWILLRLLFEQSTLDWLWSFVWIIVLARVQMLLLIVTTPAATEQGLAARLQQTLPRGLAWLVISVSWLIGCAMINDAWIVVIVAMLVLLLWRYSLQQRLGGFTGDGIGALVELTEVALLVTVVIASKIL